MDTTDITVTAVHFTDTNEIKVSKDFMENMEIGDVKTITDTVNMTVIKAINVTMEFSHQDPNGHLSSKHRQNYGHYSHQGHQKTTDIAVVKSLTDLKESRTVALISDIKITKNVTDMDTTRHSQPSLI
jgi:hypothetical protein